MTVEFPTAGSVRLDDGPFRDAQLRDKEYLLRLDPKRLLAPYFREAGLAPEAPPYENWESQGLDGHTAGHYLSAASLMFAHTGDPRFRRRAEELVEGFAAAQDALATGYVGGVPRSASLWEEVATGRIDARTFTQDGRWVPWYNLHKTFAGLIEAHRSARIPGALDVVRRLADWWLALAERIDDRDFEVMLDTEFGGMNEAFADLAALTGDDDYLAMAERFSHRAILEPLATRVDRLSGLHANTQLPKVIGYQRVGERTGQSRYATAAEFFFRTVVDTRTVSIGGHGVREHFHRPDDFGTMLEDREGPESCNSYNMVRLAAELYRASGDPTYMDYIERTLHNHVLSAQHPQHGGLVYFTPMRPNHYRVYSQPETSFWCCVGTGLEAHARHATYIFADDGARLLVNLYIDSTISWRGITVSQRAGSAPRFGTTLTIRTDGGSHRREIAARVPGWASGIPSVFVNDERIAASAVDGYLRLEREWSDGDTVRVTFPAFPRFEWLAGEREWVSVAWGPVVYAAVGDRADMPDLVADTGRMSHIARGALRPLAATPVVSEQDPRRALVGTDAGNIVLQTHTGPVTLVPFWNVHDSRYTIYFPAGDGESRRRELARRDEWQLGLDARTQDVIALGEQQPEVDHRFRGDHSEIGRDMDTAWRRTSGAMSVTLRDWRRIAKVLRLSWLDGDGNVDYELSANGIVLDRIVREGGDISPVVCTDEFALPDELRRQDVEEIVVLIRAAPGHRTDRLTEIRLLAPDDILAPN